MLLFSNVMTSYTFVWEYHGGNFNAMLEEDSGLSIIMMTSSMETLLAFCQCNPPVAGG